MKPLLQLVIGLSIVVLNAPAYAYLDPATGAIIIQALLAGLAGALITVKLFFANIKDFFARLFNKNMPGK